MLELTEIEMQNDITKAKDLKRENQQDLSFQLHASGEPLRNDILPLLPLRLPVPPPGRGRRRRKHIPTHQGVINFHILSLIA